MVPRRLLPSFSDFAFCALLLWLCVSPGAWSGLLSDGDTGWHIRSGEYILDHHTVPHTDLFSYTKPGAPWFAWEWLTDVGMAWLFRAGGLKAVVLSAGVIFAATGVVILRWSLARGSNALLTCAFTLSAMSAASLHLLARPHVLTMLLLPVAVWLLDDDQRSPGKKVWLLIPIVGIWANLHGGFVLLLAIIGLQTVAELCATRDAGSPRFTRMLLLCILCAAATCINPYGILLHWHIFNYVRSDFIRSSVQEFFAPTFHSEMSWHYLLLIAAVVAFIPIWYRRRAWREILTLLFLLYLSLQSVRHVPLFAIVAAPHAASELSSILRRYRWATSARTLTGTVFALGEDIRGAFQRTSLLPYIAVIALFSLPLGIEWPKEFPAEVFPVALVRDCRRVLKEHRVFTSDQWADYLIFQNYPEQRVFIDGRSDFYGPAIASQYTQVLRGDPEWPNILEKYSIRLILCPRNWPVRKALEQSAQWRVLSSNTQAILFESTSNKPLRSAHESAYGADIGTRHEPHSGLMETRTLAESFVGEQGR